LLTAIGLTPGGSSTVTIYTQTIHRTTQLKPWLEAFWDSKPEWPTNWEECGPCPVFAKGSAEEYPAFILSMSEFEFIQNPCNLTVCRQISSNELPLTLPEPRLVNPKVKAALSPKPLQNNTI
jgi:hypothetical protein